MKLKSYLSKKEDNKMCLRNLGRVKKNMTFSQSKNVLFGYGRNGKLTDTVSRKIKLLSIKLSKKKKKGCIALNCSHMKIKKNVDFITHFVMMLFLSSVNTLYTKIGFTC